MSEPLAPQHGGCLLGLAYLLQGSLDVDALAPGSRGIGQALPGVPSTRNVNALLSEVLEGGGHHSHPVVGERSSVLHIGMKVEQLQHLHLIAVKKMCAFHRCRFGKHRNQWSKSLEGLRQ